MPEQLRSTKAPATARQSTTPDQFDCHLSSGSDQLSAWLHVAGEVDLLTSGELEFAVRRAERSAPLVVLVLYAVTFMDSTGLGIIVDAWRRTRPPERRLVLIVNSESQLHRLLQATGLNRQLDIIDYPAASGGDERPAVCEI